MITPLALLVIAIGTLASRPGSIDTAAAVGQDGTQQATVQAKSKSVSSNPGTAPKPTSSANGKSSGASTALAATSAAGSNEDRVFAPTASWQQDYSTQPDGALNPSIWHFEHGNNNGWGNKEIENYTSKTSNARVENGNLVIQARKEADGSYTSARLTTQGSLDFAYGKIDIVAKLPTGQGIWPALWLWPTDQHYANQPVSPSQQDMAWLNDGEIDMFEGTAQGDADFEASAHSLNHYPGHGVRTGMISVANPSNTYHTYSLAWTPNSLAYMLDGRTFFTVRNPGTGFADWPYDQRYHLILNIALGGTQSQNLKSASMPNGIDDSTGPWQMNIKSISYYPLASN